jgi:hypothetical protein
MINVILDTNIYRKNPSLDSASFKALKILASNGYLQLHIPHIVFEEFISQKKRNMKNISTALKMAYGGFQPKDYLKNKRKY